MNWISTLHKESVALASKRSKQLQFAALLYAIFALIFYRVYGFTPPFYYRMIGVSIMALGWFLLPQLLYPVLFLWFFIGKVVGEFVSAILLSLLYFLFIWVAKIFVKWRAEPGWKDHEGEGDYTKMG